MSKTIIDISNHNLCGQLQKLSTSIFVGYQKKWFSLLQNGIKIAYRNPEQTQFKEENIFLIKDVVVCEAEQDFSFTLQTPRRTYFLKAKDEQTKITWMRTITKLRKQIIRKKFKATSNFNQTTASFNKSLQKSQVKNVASTTQHTIPTGSDAFLRQTNRTMKSINQLNLTQRSLRMSSAMPNNPEIQNQLKKDLALNLLKKIPQQYLKYNVFISNLKSKVQNLFTSSFTSFTYILFSSKSLYQNQQQTIPEQNMTNMMLPQWAQINKMYRVIAKKDTTPKLFLQISKIIDIQEDTEEKTVLKIRTEQNLHSFFCQTLQQKDRLKQIFTTSVNNYKQVLNDGNKLSKRNYDQLIKLYNTQYDQFLQRIKIMISKLIPNNHHYQPHVVIKFVDIAIPFLQEFISIVSKKIGNNNEVILQVLKQLHEEVKIHIKLTWDSSYSLMKGQDILKFLNALAAYHSVIKPYITDAEFMTGMKQLSKIYVRESWKNFEDIILGIVQQQKKVNIFNDQDNQYIQTNAIIDLFKFIYEVFELASPCWEHKLHLHNVQKLMSRAISVFINELKSSIDETVIANNQLIAISNNYFRFCLTIDEFYNEKFSTLQEKTKQSYDKLKAQYKELSRIVLDKLAFDIRGSIKKYFEKGNFFKINIQKLYQILKQSCANLEITLLHPIFIKRFYQKLFTTIKQNILLLLQKQISGKKKHNISKILQQLDNLAFDLLEIANLLYDGKSKIDKELNEVNILLSCQSHNQILSLIKGSEEDTRNIYLNIINLREDYYVGGPLYYSLNQDNVDKLSISGSQNKGRNTLRPMRLTISKQMEMRASFSNEYMSPDIDMHSSIDKSQTDSYQQPFKLISEGYLLKCKTNKKVWQKIYCRLKNGTLYLYLNQKSEKCQNSIPISQMTKVLVSSNENLSFKVGYISLNRQKQIEFKCEQIELRDRWLQSLTLELKRIKNDEKVSKQKLKINSKQKNKNYLIIDYQELMNGKGYFSYTNLVRST